MIRCVFFVAKGGKHILCGDEGEFMWKGFTFCREHVQMVIDDPEGTLWVCQRMD